jgi:hypothetical protein
VAFRVQQAEPPRGRPPASTAEAPGSSRPVPADLSSQPRPFQPRNAPARSAPGLGTPRPDYSIAVGGRGRESKPLDFSQAVTSVIQDYQRSTPIAFTQIVDGRAQEDTVNRKFWERRDTGSGWAWTVLGTERPSDAVRDVVLNKSPQSPYRTECRLALEMFRVAARLKMDEAKFGPQAGSLVFDARFTTPSNMGPIIKWIESWHQSNPKMTFDQYSKIHPPPTAPKGSTKLTIRQSGAGNDFQKYELFKNTELAPGTERPGDEGYFANTSVSPLGQKSGGAGQNLFVLPNKQAYGHGVGVVSFSDLRKQLSQGSIKEMSQFLEYYDCSYTNKPPTTDETKAQVAKWLRTGPLASRDKFREWIGTSEFKSWYQKSFGRPPGNVSSSLDEVKRMIEKMIPDTGKRYTAYTAMNGDIRNGPNMVSEQMALFLVGSLPEPHAFYTRTVALD